MAQCSRGPTYSCSAHAPLCVHVHLHGSHTLTLACPIMSVQIRQMVCGRYQQHAYRMERHKASVPAFALLTATPNELQDSQLEQLWAACVCQGDTCF